MASAPKAGEGTAFILMGVSGVGKTLLSRRLAKATDASYVEADDFHSPANVEAMRAGRALTDEMRKPWLVGLSKATEVTRQQGDAVVACSALRSDYRAIIRDHVAAVQFVFLTGDRDVIDERLRARTDHFMSADLLDSQLATLEPPTPEEDPITVSVHGSVDEVFSRVLSEIERKKNPNTQQTKPTELNKIPREEKP